ncbi:Oxoglutarate and iron-dependent oxygenase degradation C-term-domain-containing protein [Aspergillus cavernicola]|uniref:Oxoglutarate and iron-dependent oxygenase degradation C-term-domain-containing protein n=1 Tax=Aspergillus cavernicola TaxID=176166 RepID=A0ABR4HPP7_9EURO
MKRKNNGRESRDANGQPDSKKRALSSEEVALRFREGLFEPSEQQKYTKGYGQSTPYKHGVIHPLIEDSLLRSVRDEIQAHLHFTEKETDIYKIFQSGDLANLDGLDDGSLSRLPSILKLRDAMYSARFREFLSSVTGSGKLSGQKTDMAINVYNEGCHLLCHDDVIGSRRLSYILYLTDPDTPWQAEWGGALRLYPTATKKDAKGEDVKVPSPDFTLSIPPAFNQLSFFTVQPGESFHDVEEVYHPTEGEDKSKKRVRMAISGWFHIPQKGEDGYEEGLEEKLAERSSLSQLQGRADIYDLPQSKTVVCEDETTEEVKGKGKGKVEEEPSSDFTESDLNFLVQYIAPTYLTPDIAEEMSDAFLNDSSLNVEHFLSKKFAAKVRSYIKDQEKQGLPRSSDEIQAQTEWTVARPPHKHRYLFQQHSTATQGPATPIQELLNDLFPSKPFRKWLSLITGSDRITSYNFLARRFRRSQDYTLANTHTGDEPRLELTLGLTPTPGWEKEDPEDEDNENKTKANTGTAESSSTSESKKPNAGGEEISVGGYEIYMAGDDDEAEAQEQENKTGAADPAIYRSAADDEDDGILFSTAAGWNRLSIVLRDSGTLKFVKYVSAAAKGDRWDVTGEMGVEFNDDDADEGEEGEDEDEDDGDDDDDDDDDEYDSMEEEED